MNAGSVGGLKGDTTSLHKTAVFEAAKGCSRIAIVRRAATIQASGAQNWAEAFTARERRSRRCGAKSRWAGDSQSDARVPFDVRVEVEFWTA